MFPGKRFDAESKNLMRQTNCTSVFIYGQLWFFLFLCPCHGPLIWILNMHGVFLCSLPFILLLSQITFKLYFPLAARKNSESAYRKGISKFCWVFINLWIGMIWKPMNILQGTILPGDNQEFVGEFTVFCFFFLDFKLYH